MDDHLIILNRLAHGHVGFQIHVLLAPDAAGALDHPAAFLVPAGSRIPPGDLSVAPLHMRPTSACQCSCWVDHVVAISR